MANATTEQAGPAAGNASQGLQAPAASESNEPKLQLSAKDEGTEQEEKSRKRDFFRFGKKEDDKKKVKTPVTVPAPTITQTGTAGGLRPTSPLAPGDNLRSPGSPARNHPYGAPTSPRNMRSASPRTHSPASSMIFERNVQEDVGVAQASPQIPSHIVTENHIPPALDATSEAITDAKLDPDSVEIVTHATHQPAAVTITSGFHDQPASPTLVHEGSVAPVARQDSDNVSNYASLESGDVRRLSFISFADVVHAEHDVGDVRRDSSHISGATGLVAPRSPSPMRSPVSSQVLGTSPPTSVSASAHEASPNRNTSELNFETMRQALRKTGSGDLSAIRSHTISAVGTEDGVERHAR